MEKQKKDLIDYTAQFLMDLLGFIKTCWLTLLGRARDAKPDFEWHKPRDEKPSSTWRMPAVVALFLVFIGIFNTFNEVRQKAG